MKKDSIFIIFFNVISLFLAVVLKYIENNNASILYILLLILIFDLFFIVSQRKLHEEQNKILIQMEKNQERLVESERLSSLGQLIGGIAHNLKTPIMSISGALEGLNDLIREYDQMLKVVNGK
jgi:signal transduction histidine kinase